MAKELFLGLSQSQHEPRLITQVLPHPLRVIDTRAGCFNQCLVLQPKRNPRSGLVVLRAPKPVIV